MLVLLIVLVGALATFQLGSDLAFISSGADFAEKRLGHVMPVGEPGSFPSQICWGQCI